MTGLREPAVLDVIAGDDRLQRRRCDPGAICLARRAERTLMLQAQGESSRVA